MCSSDLIIDAERLNFGVRDGNQCGPLAKSTRTLSIKSVQIVMGIRQGADGPLTKSTRTLPISSLDCQNMLNGRALILPIRRY